MKIKTLIPLTALTGVASMAILPSASCSRKFNGISWTINDGLYTLDDNRLEAKEHDISDEKREQVEKELTKTYIENVTKDWSIFANDYANVYLLNFGPFCHISSGNDEVCIINSLEMRISNIVKDNLDYNIFRVSFTLHIDCFLIGFSVMKDQHAKFDLVCENIPYVGFIEGYGSDDAHYVITLNNRNHELETDEDWKMSVAASHQKTVREYIFTYENYPGEWGQNEPMLSFFFISLLTMPGLEDIGPIQPSWYMSQQTFKSGE